jgi:hypothetical protein
MSKVVASWGQNTTTQAASSYNFTVTTVNGKSFPLDLSGMGFTSQKQFETVKKLVTRFTSSMNLK